MASALAEHPDRITDCALRGGDDYELCFTVPKTLRTALIEAASGACAPISHIGEITATPGLIVLDAGNRVLDLPTIGYDHFGAAE
jgi:thiamine-monophosphate kinase